MEQINPMLISIDKKLTEREDQMEKDIKEVKCKLNQFKNSLFEIKLKTD
jgi:hypothetical protein